MNEANTRRGLGNEPPPLVGRTLSGRYRLEETIGHGAVSVVFRATDLELGRDVAVKVLVAPGQNADRYADRLEQEARLLQRIRHPAVVEVFHYGESDGFHFIVMELLSGTTLRVRLGRSGRLPVDRAVAVASMLAGAVGAIHEAGFLHRDLKPGNVFLVPAANGDERVKLVDLGFARRLPAATHGAGAPGSDLLAGRGVAIRTVRGIVFGSPVYMSPEQAMGHELDERSDVYALGVIAYELLCGHAPFEGGSVMRVLARHVGEPPEPLTDRARNVPSRVADVVLEALAKDPSDRPASAAQFAQELRLALAAETFVDDEPPRPPLRRGLPPLAYAALALLAVAGAGAWIAIGAPHPSAAATASAQTPAASASPSRVVPAGAPLVTPATEASGRATTDAGERRARARSVAPPQAHRAQEKPAAPTSYRIDDLKTPSW